MVNCLPASLEEEDPLQRVGSSKVKDTMSLQFMVSCNRRNRWVCGSGSVPSPKNEWIQPLFHHRIYELGKSFGSSSAKISYDSSVGFMIICKMWSKVHENTVPGTILVVLLLKHTCDPLTPPATSQIPARFCAQAGDVKLCCWSEGLIKSHHCPGDKRRLSNTVQNVWNIQFSIHSIIWRRLLRIIFPQYQSN